MVAEVLVVVAFAAVVSAVAMIEEAVVAVAFEVEAVASVDEVQAAAAVDSEVAAAVAVDRIIVRIRFCRSCAIFCMAIVIVVAVFCPFLFNRKQMMRNNETSSWCVSLDAVECRRHQSDSKIDNRSRSAALQMERINQRNWK